MIQEIGVWLPCWVVAYIAIPYLYRNRLVLKKKLIPNIYIGYKQIGS